MGQPKDIMVQLNHSVPREMIIELRKRKPVAALHEGERWTQVRFRAGTTFEESGELIVVVNTGTVFENNIVRNLGYEFNVSFSCAWVDLITIWESGKILWKNPDFKFNRRSI